MTHARPNIVFVYADDLGRGMLGCYGQRWFSTPNIDRVANEGVRFTRSYGCAFCAPARASLLMGVHDCHDGRWTYTRGGSWTKVHTGELSAEELSEIIHNTGMQAASGERFLAEIPREAGYTTGQIGKLEWGFSTTGDRLRRHGWDYHFGYYDHVRCHGFYPSFLWENGQRVDLPGNTHLYCGRHRGGPETDTLREFRRNRQGRAIYSQDVFNQKIVEFIRSNKERPFFLYHPSQLPHGPISVPEIHPAVAGVDGLTEYEKEYASMVLRLDDTVGIIYDELERAGILDNTIIIFSADNGHELYYQQDGRTTKQAPLYGGKPFDNVDSKFYSYLCGDVFNGNDGMAGLKFSSWEGGTRVPWIVRWPERFRVGETTDAMMAAYDLMPTIAELLDVRMPDGKDGQSFLATLTGSGIEAPHDPIVFASGVGPAIVTEDGLKVRRVIDRNRFQLFDLRSDPGEEHDLAGDDPQRAAALGERLLAACGGDFIHGTPHDHLRDYGPGWLNVLNPAVNMGLKDTP